MLTQKTSRKISHGNTLLLFFLLLPLVKISMSFPYVATLRPTPRSYYIQKLYFNKFKKNFKNKILNLRRDLKIIKESIVKNKIIEMQNVICNLTAHQTHNHITKQKIIELEELSKIVQIE